jgi:hypothetical protein
MIVGAPEWAFGDGTDGLGKNTTHSYNGKPNEYTVGVKGECLHLGLVSPHRFTNSKTHIAVKLEILNPPDSEKYQIVAESNYTSTSDITFKGKLTPAKGQVDWVLTVEYDNLTGPEKTFVTASEQEHLDTYSSTGGKVTVTASPTLDKDCRKQRVIYVVGGIIPPEAVTELLRTLYIGHTTGLLTGVASKESSYTMGRGQFWPESEKYGITARWPQESPVHYVGLMQVPKTMVDCWNWDTNCRTGASIYAEKLGVVDRIVANYRYQYPNLPPLTPIQREDWALSRYGNWGNLYAPNAQGTDWELASPSGKVYVDDIRSRIIP